MIPRRSSVLRTVLLCLALAGPASTAPSPPPEFILELDAQGGEVYVAYRGQLVAVYRFKPHPFKPHLRDLYTLEGVNVLLDAPEDHLHHHGLMYAVKVNDVNFWEESDQAGYQLSGPDISRRVSRRPGGYPAAELEHTVFWVPTKASLDPAPAAWLAEQRTLRFTIDEPAREVAVEWHSRFKVGPAIEEARLTGTAYHGLGLRLAREFDHTARRQNAAGLGYTTEATWDITPALWASATQTVRDREVVITLFHDPANAAEPRFFSMLNAFAYLSATQGLDLAPLVYRQGQEFTLRYLMTVHSRGQSAEATTARHQAWLAPQTRP
jgi:hypothetical protein